MTELKKISKGSRANNPLRTASPEKLAERLRVERDNILLVHAQQKILYKALLYSDVDDAMDYAVVVNSMRLQLDTSLEKLDHIQVQMKLHVCAAQNPPRGKASRNKQAEPAEVPGG